MKLVKRPWKEFLIATVVTLLITSAIVGGAVHITAAKKNTSQVTRIRPQQQQLQTQTVSAATTNERKLITTSDIAENAVTSPKIKDGEVNTNDITDGAVTNPKVQNGAVTTDKVADNTVTTDKLADNAVTTAKIKDGTILIKSYQVPNRRRMQLLVNRFSNIVTKF
ncbi:MAG: hypothetical protein ACHQXG_09910 [Nitrososphaerales archaeon]